MKLAEFLKQTSSDPQFIKSWFTDSKDMDIEEFTTARKVFMDVNTGWKISFVRPETTVWQWEFTDPRNAEGPIPATLRELYLYVVSVVSRFTRYTELSHILEVSKVILGSYGIHHIGDVQKDFQEWCLKHGIE